MSGGERNNGGSFSSLSLSPSLSFSFSFSFISLSLFPFSLFLSLFFSLFSLFHLSLSLSLSVSFEGRRPQRTCTSIKICFKREQLHVECATPHVVSGRETRTNVQNGAPKKMSKLPYVPAAFRSPQSRCPPARWPEAARSGRRRPSRRESSPSPET